mgnify:CR=1 FL=1
MKVSIITSCYNREATIRGAIESVLEQDYPYIEYIVVDGASKDNSLAVINEYKNGIDTIISEPDKGMYEAINKGIRDSNRRYYRSDSLRRFPVLISHHLRHSENIRGTRCGYDIRQRSLCRL